jgi:hypothetical protein
MYDNTIARATPSNVKILPKITINGINTTRKINDPTKTILLLPIPKNFEL